MVAPPLVESLCYCQNWRFPYTLTLSLRRLTGGKGVAETGERRRLEA
jgi:hypothetical protein